MSRYSRFSPFARDEFRDQEGGHADESDFNIFDEVCPPGRINSFTQPPTRRMRLIRGEYWRGGTEGYAQMSPSSELIDQYKSLRAQGKIEAYGAGHEPFRWGYMAQNAIVQAASAEIRGLSMDSFLDLLLKPEAERPSNIRECIDYFYPLSGSIPPDKDISPFVSTSIAAYTVPNQDPAEAGNIPLQLGEVSMMYGWYLAWRLILCPNKYGAEIDRFLSTESASPDFPFRKVPNSEILLNHKVRSTIAREGNDAISTLADISTAVGVVADIAQAAVTSGVGLPDSFEDVRAIAAEQLGISNPEDFAEELMYRYGTAFVASSLAEYVEIPYTHLNDLASVVVNGAMSADKWQSLQDDASSAINSATKRAALAAQNIAKSYVADRVEMIAGDTLSADQATGLTSIFEDFMITGIPSDTLTQRVDNIRRKAANQRSAMDRAIIDVFDTKSREVQRRSRRILEDFSRYGNARPNPEPLTRTVIGIAAAGKLIQGGLSYHAAKVADEVGGASNYLTDNLYRLDPYLQSGEASFDLSKHIRKGYWFDFKWWQRVGGENDWYNSATRPDCMLQQGGQVLDYWIHVWSRVRTIITAFKLDRETFEERTGGNEALRNQQFGRHMFTKYFKTVGTLKQSSYPAYGSSDLFGFFGGGTAVHNRPRKETYYREESQVPKGTLAARGLAF